MTNADIAKVLKISGRSVQNKRYGHTKWTLEEYITLVMNFGKENARRIANGLSIDEIDVSKIKKAKSSGKDVSID